LDEMTDVYVCIAIWALGILMGYMFKKWLVERKISGTIYVIRQEDKTLYSLELSGYPESLMFQKEVVFKVDAPKESREDN